MIFLKYLFVAVFYFLMKNLLLIQNSRKQFSTQDDLADWQVLLILFTWEGVVPKLMIRSHIKLIKYTSPPVIACHHFFKTVLHTLGINYFDAQESSPFGRRNLIWADTLLMKCNPMRVAPGLNSLQGQGSINCFRYKTWPSSARQALSAL